MAVKAGAFSAAALLALTACGNGEGEGNGDDGNGEAAADGDVITIGIAGEVPYSYLNDDGEPEGATVALSEEIFGELGYEVEAELTDWDNLIPGLNAGQFEAISAGMSILPERCEEASFAEPEIMYTTALLVEEGNPHDVQDLEDVLAAQEAGDDITVATLTAGIEAGYVDDLGIDAQGVGSADDGVDMVTGGRADVFALTAISLTSMAEDLDGVEVTEPFTQEVSAGSTVFRDEDSELLEQYNEQLAELKSDESRFLDIIGEFGFTEAEIPPAEMTAEELCEGDVEALEAEYLD